MADSYQLLKSTRSRTRDPDVCRTSGADVFVERRTARRRRSNISGMLLADRVQS